MLQSHATADLETFTWALQAASRSHVSVREELIISGDDHSGYLW